MEPLQDIEQATSHVRQNVREFSWLWLGLIFAGGLVIRLLLGYLPLRSDMNQLVEHVDQIDHYLAAQQPQPATTPAPAPPSGKKHGQH